MTVEFAGQSDSLILNPPMPINREIPNDAKLKELILFIALRSQDDPRFGSTKLNKLLFFADFGAYAKLGSSITGHAYFKLKNGPAPRAMLPIRDQMIEEKTLAIQDRDHFGRMQKVPIALREPDLTQFTPQEIAVVTDVLMAFRNENARAISELSHRFDGWKLAGDGELIPYEVTLVRFKKPTEQDRETALAMGPELAALRMECERYGNR
jgi:hypothetical protein